MPDTPPFHRYLITCCLLGLLHLFTKTFHLRVQFSDTRTTTLILLVYAALLMAVSLPVCIRVLGEFSVNATVLVIVGKHTRGAMSPSSIEQCGVTPYGGVHFFFFLQA